MEGTSTKQKILKEALHLFSEQGYDAVSVGQIADAVGIKAPSLYKHYKSKQAIFDAILAEMTKRYEEQAASLQMNGIEPKQDMGLFLNLDEEQLVEMGKGLFLYFLHDEYISKFRKMLTLEQYHNRELASLYTKQYIDDPLAYQGMLFGLLVQAEIFTPEDPHIMALHFYAPMYLLLNLCECYPEKEIEVLLQVERHLRQFNRMYRKEEG